MRSEKKNRSPSTEKMPKTEKCEKTKRISLYEARLGEFIHAVSLINSIEAHWDSKEIILSFDKRESMVPLMFLTDCVFASKNGNVQKIASN